jgi:hypothetical protein
MDRHCGSVIAETLNRQMMGKFVSLAGLIQAWLFIEFAEHAPGQAPTRFSCAHWFVCQDRTRQNEKFSEPHHWRDTTAVGDRQF